MEQALDNEIGIVEKISIDQYSNPILRWLQLPTQKYRLFFAEG